MILISRETHLTIHRRLSHYDVVLRTPSNFYLFYLTLF